MDDPVLLPKLKLTAPELPPFLADYAAIAKKMPNWAVRAALMSQYPRHLYNYLRFDSASEESLRNLSTMLVDSNLYLNDPADFNDPFEFKNRLVLDDDEVLKHFFSVVHSVTHPNDTRSPSARDALIEELVAKVKTAPEQIFGVLFETHSHGVHCFTPEPKSQLMWSHYADSHRGICLQFRTSYDVPTFLAAGAVDYCDDFPDFHIPTAPQADTVAMMMRKGTSWSYEKERRIAMLAINSRLLSFEPRALTGLILGSRFPKKHLPAIQQMLAKRFDRGLPKVQLYQAEAQDTAYRLSVRKLESMPLNSGAISGVIPWDSIYER
ncbi:DUF2971 domain-containing protein [Stenotrophomonas sp. NPDC078853]|uniref:DUF2971 domain-containing protein n=1 Tax=Stenotrophomonas sp. NPDC078853 TaxID=3364534 RepID=UPI00384C4B19